MSRPPEEFWKYLGFGLMVFLMCLGLGTCTLLISIEKISFPG